MFRQNKYLFPVLILLLSITVITAIAFGAVQIVPADMISAIKNFIQGKEPANIFEAVFLQIRLPRVLLCLITGAILAVSGVLMQGLFRNPIVEPGLAGTSSGAAFGAALVFVLAGNISPAVKSFVGPLLLPVVAFITSLLATYMVYAFAVKNRTVSVVSLLLTGVAVNAICISGTGFLSYIARDPQARSITFWNLGTFSGAAWWQVSITGLIAALCFIPAFRYSKQLNSLLLGDDEATYIGTDTDKLKKRIMMLNTAMVAVATSFVGVIGFVGLIVPHILRLLIGSDNRKLLPASMFAGAILLTLADTFARIIIAPAELPIGIITSIVGAPVFIVLLKKFSLPDQKGGSHG